MPGPIAGRRATDKDAISVTAKLPQRGKGRGGRAKSTAELPQTNAEHEQAKRGPMATDEAAEQFGVSGRIVRDAKYVATNDPELFEVVNTN